MECGFCGEINPEDATYCKKCGRRLDGQAVCPSCGKVVPADGEFCIYCGARLSPVNGAMPNNAAQPAAAAARPAVDKDKLRGIFGLVSTICAGLSALFAFIFVFCIGSSSTFNIAGAAGDLPMVGINIYYYFGQAYGQITQDVGSFAQMCYTWGAAIGTVVCALGLAGTIACFIVAIVGFVKALTKKSGSAIGISAATYFSFVCSAVLFMVCGAGVLSANGMAAGLVLNGTTVAGIVVGGIFLVASVVLDCLARGVNVKLSEYIFNICHSVVPVILSIVLVALFGAGVVMIGDAQATGQFGVSTFFEVYAMAYPTVSGEQSGEFSSDFVSSSACVIAAAVLIVICCALFVLAQKKTYNDLGHRSSGTGKALYVAAGGLASIVGVLTCISSIIFAKWASGGEAGVAAAVPVLTMVFGLLLCCYPIVFSLIGSKIKEQPGNNLAQA